MIAVRDMMWVLSVVIIATAVVLRLKDGSAGFYALLTIPATLFLVGDTISSFGNKK
jgi:hypothetical protein